MIPRAFIVGMLWAILTAVVPAVSIIAENIHENEQTDWHEVRTAIGSGILLGGTLGWRRYRALIKLPPDIAGVLDFYDASPRAAQVQAIGAAVLDAHTAK